ncbi:MAG: hypothetical protein H6619_03985 [Deltaproteobacteria bacterium]|nr:hypothetical protein [Deltaproteobacteria bacterium]
MKLIRLSERDQQTLDKILSNRDIKSENQPQNYADKVVVKPWGFEFLAYENDEVAVWFLHIDKGHSTSMHCHPLKKTALTVLRGQALCNTFYNRNYLYGVDGVVIENGVFHSTQALSEGGIDLIEVETPPNKTDLVRLKDQYGRSGAGYEGLSEMKTDNLDRYNYFAFNTPENNQEDNHIGNGYKVSILTVPSKTEAAQFMNFERGVFYCSCAGDLVQANGETALTTGDVAEGAYLETCDSLITTRQTTLLRFEPNLK